MKEFFIDYFGKTAASIAEKIVFSIIVFVIGCVFIRFIKKVLPKSKLFSKFEPSAKSFILSTLKILMYAMLIVTVISVLGVPTTSIIAAITSAFLAVGLALQGALSNFAGGIMILLFKPFMVGDYITCTGGTGKVSEISVFYTSIITDEKKRITVPNGTLMNDAVINHTAEEFRRVDAEFTVAYNTNIQLLSNTLSAAAEKHALTIEFPVSELKVISYSDTGVVCSFRTWCRSENYWELYYDMMKEVDVVLNNLNISAPTSRIVLDSDDKHF